MRETGENPNQSDREVSGRCHSGTELNSKTKKLLHNLNGRMICAENWICHVRDQKAEIAQSGVKA